MDVECQLSLPESVCNEKGEEPSIRILRSDGICYKKFHAVNDPYILWGLYAAVYGVIVCVDKADFSRSIAEQILSYHYGEAGKAPQDLMVRHRTLKILELVIIKTLQ